IINSNDTNWEFLKIWRDLNQNGITDIGELFTLEDLSIESLNINYTETNQTINNGNYIYGTASYVTNDGYLHEIADVFLVQRTIISQFVNEVDVLDENFSENQG
ncbi:MAG: hypothetical protein LBT62_04995, partial [Deltaproteobacteria bacterium]|nr:hypothetical protein [Deltaproteobacteria bacterium]